jgi:AraC-like DNA-binding protein
MNVVLADTTVFSSPGPGANTDQLRHLLRQALRQLDETDTPNAEECARYISKALRLHIGATRVGGPGRHTSGGLSTWQVRRVEAMALAQLDAPMPVAQLAEACQLSRGYFTRAFKATFGESPHRWRQRRQIDFACDLLKNSSVALADVAGMCGFCDQAHLTRVFRGAKGVTPYVYRMGLMSS